MSNVCPHCGASVRQRWDRITAGEVDFLIRFKARILEKQENLIDVPKEMKLSNIEYSDFQKLRYHALIAKKRENGVAKRGLWVLTRLGNLFLKGQVAIPERVRVFRNQINARSKELVTIEDVMQKTPRWDGPDDILYEDIPVEQDVTEMLDGQMKIFVTERKGKKRKKPCPQCPAGVLRGMIEEEPGEAENSVKVRRSLKCTICEYKAYVK